LLTRIRTGLHQCYLQSISHPPVHPPGNLTAEGACAWKAAGASVFLPVLLPPQSRCVRPASVLNGRTSRQIQERQISVGCPLPISRLLPGSALSAAPSHYLH